MDHADQSLHSSRRLYWLLVAGLLAFAIVVPAAGRQPSRPASPTVAPARETVRTDARVTPAAPDGALPEDRRGGLGAADGVLPDGTTAFEDGLPGLTNLDPGLRDALRRAASDAVRDGVDIVVDSGWRSPAYQERLLREAISRYGSEAEAARWVATPETSPHVAGDAVDVGPSAAASWLSTNGAAYGLCQVYRNEPWHYERRPGAVDGGCPPMYADPTSDPRMARR